VLGSEQRSEFNRRQIGDLVQIGDQLSLTLTLSLTLPDLNLAIFPSIPCLVSGRRSVIIQLLLKRKMMKVMFNDRKLLQGHFIKSVQ